MAKKEDTNNDVRMTKTSEALSPQEAIQQRGCQLRPSVRSVRAKEMPEKPVDLSGTR